MTPLAYASGTNGTGQVANSIGSEHHRKWFSPVCVSLPMVHNKLDRLLYSLTLKV